MFQILTTVCVRNLPLMSLLKRFALTLNHFVFDTPTMLCHLWYVTFGAIGDAIGHQRELVKVA